MWPENYSSELDANSNVEPLLERSTIVELSQRFAESDRKLGIETTTEFTPFTQRNDVFTRAFWDHSVRSKATDGFFESYRLQFSSRKGNGFSRRDFALRNAAWSVSDLISSRSESEGRREGFQAPVEVPTEVAADQVELLAPAVESQQIKSIARLFGADLVGITDLDLRWHYATRVDTRDFSEASNKLPEGITHVIVMGHAMDSELVSTYPSALAGASTGLEYSREAAIATQLASYIRNLGFEAVASMNDTALVIPYAIKAGLGEYGRNQMLLTPEFGPRVRFSKVFTNLPLITDDVKPLGIKDYCDICQRCADACPPKALPYGPATDRQINQSTIKGVVKWSANAEKCFGYWATLKTDCAICMRVCPFNRSYITKSDKLFRKIATSRFRRVAFWWDEKFGAARKKRLSPLEWWRSIGS